MDKFYKDYLDGLGVYELRAIARKVGVKSPTTKKHHELVDGILKIQNGEEKAFVTSKGRPPKAVTLGQINATSFFEKEEGLAIAFDYAKDRGFDYFSTTLSISPHKDAKRLNDYGTVLAGDNGASPVWLYSDFKKKNGYKRSCELSEQYDLYRQNFCGCVYSRK